MKLVLSSQATLFILGRKGFSLSQEKKKKQLFLDQKKTLYSFLKTGAISRLQYDKSCGDLVKKMGMESVAEELEKDQEVKG